MAEHAKNCQEQFLPAADGLALILPTPCFVGLQVNISFLVLGKSEVRVMTNKNAYLKEMGIDVWVERNPEVKNQDIVNVGRPIPIASERKVERKPEVIPTTSIVEAESSVIETIDIKSLDWQALQKKVASCQLCELSQARTQTNFGVGNQTASLMIIADETNEQSGKLLSSMLKAMDYQRSDVYISNIIKCGTDENNDASELQVELCEPYLLRQISLLQPKLILALGNASAHRLLKSKSTMNRLRGQLHYVDGINAPILVSYHPTYLLAAPNEKRKAWEDLQLAMKELVE